MSAAYVISLKIGAPSEPARSIVRVTIEEARARYVDPEPVPNLLEVREVSEQRGHGLVLSAKTKG